MYKFENRTPKGANASLLTEKPLGYYREYVHPTTGRSIVIDNATRSLLQVGGDGFKW